MKRGVGWGGIAEPTGKKQKEKGQHVPIRIKEAKLYKGKSKAFKSRIVCTSHQTKPCPSKLGLIFLSEKEGKV